MTHGRKIWLLAAPLALVAALSGCGGGGDQPRVASAGKPGGANSAAAAPKDDAEAALKFTQCMRAEGVDMPDPGAGNQDALPAGNAVPDGTPLSAADKKAAAAMDKCRKFLPAGGEDMKPSQADIAQARAVAKCMRANGVPDFPDPDPVTGMTQLNARLGEDPTYDKASEKCQGIAMVTPSSAPAK